MLSIGQLLACGYSVVFNEEMCIIKDRETGASIATIQKTKNNMFPLEVSNMNNHGLAVSMSKDSTTWHLSYGHLNIKGSRLLNQKQMVKGLPIIDDIDIYEGCIYGKQARRSFPSGQAWRASTP